MTQPTVDELLSAANADIVEVDTTSGEKLLLAATARAQVAAAMSLTRCAAALEAIAHHLGQQVADPLEDDPFAAAERDAEQVASNRRRPTQRKRGPRAGVAADTERVRRGR